MSGKRLDIAQLATLVAIVDAGSITKASASLNRTQAAVSIQLKKLESITGKQLLNRSYKEVSLTAEGEILTSYARRILRLSEEALEALDDDQVEGVVRFGVPDGYARAFVQSVIVSFSRRFPKIRLEIKNAPSPRLFEHFHQGDLDLILVTRSPKQSGGTILRREKIVWVAGKDYDLAEDSSIPLAVYQPGCDYRRKILDGLNESGRSCYIAFECQGVTGFDIAITSGLAISALSESLLKDEWRQLDSSLLPELGHIEIELHRSPGEASRALQCFAREIQERVQNSKN